MRLKSLLSSCLGLVLMASWPAGTLAQTQWEERLKMPYSADSVVLLRQFTPDAEDAEGKGYFAFYRLALKPLKQRPKSDCAALIPPLSRHIQNKLQETSEGAISAEEVHIAEALCLDLDQNDQPDVFFKIHNGYHFGARHAGLFLYEQDGENVLNLLGASPSYIQGDELFLRPPAKNTSRSDLLALSYTGLYSKEVYLEPFHFSEQEAQYTPGPLKYADHELLYETRNKKLGSPDFNSSRVDGQSFVMNRSGSLIGLLHREGVYASSFFEDQLMVIETASGRAEAVYLTDRKKPLLVSLKKRFPKYMQTDGFAIIETSILGFQQDRLIFKVNLSGSCHQAMPGPPCNDKNIQDMDQLSQRLAKEYPTRFAGYWSYHYRTGALQLISWDSKTPINVEHTGYDALFQ